MDGIVINHINRYVGVGGGGGGGGDFITPQITNKLVEAVYMYFIFHANICSRRFNVRMKERRKCFI